MYPIPTPIKASILTIPELFANFNAPIYTV